MNQKTREAAEKAGIFRFEDKSSLKWTFFWKDEAKICRD